MMNESQLLHRCLKTFTFFFSPSEGEKNSTHDHVK